MGMAFLWDANRVPDIVAVVGVLLWFAGLHLLWLSRAEILAWLEEFVRLFRMSVRQSSEAVPAAPLPDRLPPARPGRAVRIAVGVALAFFLAPVLITIGLAF
jgi:hypothetical protein